METDEGTKERSNLREAANIPLSALYSFISAHGGAGFCCGSDEPRQFAEAVECPTPNFIFAIQFSI